MSTASVDLNHQYVYHHRKYLCGGIYPPQWWICTTSVLQCVNEAVFFSWLTAREKCMCSYVIFKYIKYIQLLFRLLQVDNGCKLFKGSLVVLWLCFGRLPFLLVTVYIGEESSTKLCKVAHLLAPYADHCRMDGYSWLEASRQTTRLPARVSHCCPLLLACIQSYCLGYIWPLVHTLVAGCRCRPVFSLSPMLVSMLLLHATERSL